MFNQATTAAANSSDNNRDSVDWDKFETEMKRLSLMTSEKVFLEAGFSQAQVEQFHLDNACATRVSMALTAAGAPISSGGLTLLEREL